MTISTKWQAWIQKNERLIAHPCNYELRFVESILAGISELSPDDVHAQFPFKDQLNGNRRIDFMILNEAKGLRLAIEIDGLAKVQPEKEVFNYAGWNDMLTRQNALLRALGCMLLRYSNQAWKYRPADVRTEIRSELLRQEFEFSQRVAQKITEQERQNTLEIDLQKKEIERAKAVNDMTSISILSQKIDGLLEANTQLQKIIREQTNTSQHLEAENNKILRELEHIRRSAPLHNVGENAQEFLVADNPESAESENNRMARILAKKLTGVPVISSAVVLDPDQQDELASKIKQQLPVPEKTKQPILLLTVVCFLIVVVCLLVWGPHYLTSNEDIVVENRVQVSSVQKPSPPPPVIPESPTVLRSEQAGEYAGEIRTVCGPLVQITSSGKANFLNFSKRYPDTPFNAVIWDENAADFIGINQHTGQEVCVNGMIEMYKNKPRIQLIHKNQLSITR